MKRNFPAIASSLACVLLGACVFLAQAQDQPKAAPKPKPKPKPTTWAEKKAQILKPLTAEEEGMIEQALPGGATAKPKAKRKILVFYRCEGFVHASIVAGNRALEKMGEKTGAYRVEVTDDYAAFSAENLAGFDAVLFNNTTHLKFKDAAHRHALMDFVKSGKGIIGIHAASDNFYDWPDAAAMMGGQFNGHPWGAGGTWAFKLNDAGHALNRVFAGKGFWHSDEIYWYKPETYTGPDKLRILFSLDLSKDANLQELSKPKIKDNPKYKEILAKPKSIEVPVAWVRRYRGGRLFYSNLGHRKETFWNPVMLQHYLDGIQYALGDLKADAKPTAGKQALKAVPAPDRPAG